MLFRTRRYSSASSNEKGVIHSSAPTHSARYRFERPSSAPLILNGGSPSPASHSNQDPRAAANEGLSTVEQRLNIVKRNRAVSAGRGDGVAESSKGSNSSRSLSKHEQHVVDVMIGDCIDALLFPTALHEHRES